MKKIIIWVVIVIIVVALVGAGVWWWSSRGGPAAPATGENATSTGPAPITDIVLNRTAYQIALTRAAQWKSDAALLQMTSMDTTGGTWDMIFVSAKTKGTGFEVVTNGQGITSAAETPITAGGMALPADVISPDDAIAQVRAPGGYPDAVIVSVQLLYNAPSHGWYWGIRTNTGVTVSVSATK